jgi:hypothetical protein
VLPVATLEVCAGKERAEARESWVAQRRSGGPKLVLCRRNNFTNFGANIIWHGLCINLIRGWSSWKKFPLSYRSRRIR